MLIHYLGLTSHLIFVLIFPCDVGPVVYLYSSIIHFSMDELYFVVQRNAVHRHVLTAHAEAGIR